MNMTGCRYSVTGTFGYKFYMEKELKCTVSSNVVPSPPVSIEPYYEVTFEEELEPRYYWESFPMLRFAL